MTNRLALLLAALLLSSATPASAQPGRHPLDPLSREEIEAAAAVLREAGRLGPAVRFATLELHEPPKPQVLVDTRAGRTGRIAFALLYDWASNTASEAVVDLDRHTVASWRSLPPGEPPLRVITIRRLNEVVKADPRFQATLRRRGIADASRVTILAHLAEGQPLTVRDGDRFVDAFAFLNDAPPPGLGIDRLRMEVNLTRGVLSVYQDTGAPPSGAPAASPFDGGRAGVRPLEVVQREGVGFTVNGSELRWQGWRLRFGVHPRRGLELYGVGYEDGGRVRPILYRASISEVIAPYGDPSFASWYPRDEGDYGLGNYSRTSAVPLADAPANAVFASAIMPDDRGGAVEVPRAVAIYERDGGVLWRHGLHSRRARQLVVCSFATVDNYDYVFNWIFGQDGSLEVQVQLTGIMNANPTPRQRDTVSVHDEHASFGHLVAPGVNAPNHQHFFSYRLDLDVDGPANRVLEMDTEPAPRGNPRGEWFVMRERVVGSERDGRRSMSLAASRRWKVASAEAENALGQRRATCWCRGRIPCPCRRPAPRRGCAPASWTRTCG